MEKECSELELLFHQIMANMKVKLFIAHAVGLLTGDGKDVWFLRQLLLTSTVIFTGS